MTMRTIAIDDDLKKHLDKIMADRSHNRPELIALKEAVYKQHPDWYSRYQTLGELYLNPGDKVYFHTGSSKLEGEVVVKDGELCIRHESSLNAGVMAHTPIKNSVTPAWSVKSRIHEQSVEKRLAHALRFYSNRYPWQHPDQDDTAEETAIQNILHGNCSDDNKVDFLLCGMLNLMRDALEQLQALEYENTEREKAWTESEDTIRDLREKIKELDGQISSLSWELSEVRN